MRDDPVAMETDSGIPVHKKPHHYMTDPINETYVEINNAALEASTPRPGLRGVLNPAPMVAGALLSLSSLVFAADTLAWDKTFPPATRVRATWISTIR